MGNARTVRTVIRVRLAELNKTQTWLAKKVRTSPGPLSEMLSGRRHMSDDIKKRIKTTLGVDVDAYQEVA